MFPTSEHRKKVLKNLTIGYSQDWMSSNQIRSFIIQPQMLHHKAKCHLIFREQKDSESLIYSQCVSLLLPSASHVPAKKEQRQGGRVEESSDRGHQPAHLHCQATADHAERYFSTPLH